MLGRLYENQACSAARALEIVGERWSLLILRDALFAGHARFSQFQKSLGLAPNVLAKRLESLVADGILEAKPSKSGSEHVVYVPTAKGLDFRPVIMALTFWGDKWVRPGPALLKHADCGGLVEQRLLCTACGETLKVTELRAEARQRSSAVRSK